MKKTLSLLIFFSVVARAQLVPPGTTAQLVPIAGFSSSTAVTSITGTANQILANASTSAQTGAVTLTIPSAFIAPGSIAATTTLAGTSATLTSDLTFGTSASILSGTTGSIGLTAVGSNQSITISPTGTGQILAGVAGTAAKPVFSTAGDSDTGWYSSGSNTWTFASGGVDAATFTRDLSGGGLDLVAQGTNQNLYFAASGSGGIALTAGSGAGSITLQSATNVSTTAGPFYAAQITRTYNQASGTAANTDLLINRTQTAVGSGAQLLIDAQVSTVSKFKVDNVGSITLAGTGNVTAASLAGTGSRAVLADATGLLSAPVSDENLKDPLRPLPESYGIDAVMRLRPSVFKFKDKVRFGAQDYIGFGARSTAKVVPEVTGQDRDGTYYLTDEKLTAVLVKAVQQQQAQIERPADWWARGIATLALVLAIAANLRRK